MAFFQLDILLLATFAHNFILFAEGAAKNSVVRAAEGWLLGLDLRFLF